MWYLWWTKCHWGRFAPSTSVSPAYSHSSIRGWYNRPNSGRLTRWTVSPHPKKLAELAFGLILSALMLDSKYISKDWMPCFWRHRSQQTDIRTVGGITIRVSDTRYTRKGNRWQVQEEGTCGKQTVLIFRRVFSTAAGAGPLAARPVAAPHQGDVPQGMSHVLGHLLKVDYSAVQPMSCVLLAKREPDTQVITVASDVWVFRKGFMIWRVLATGI
jgi:hypothetical protein